jgi:uncharacterized protein (DUF1778 family)
MAQPRRAEGGSSDVIANMRITQEERALIRRAAALHRQKPSDFMRDVVLDAASETIEDDQSDTIDPTQA